MFIESNPIPVKYAVNQIGMNVGDPRLPMIAPSEKARAHVDELLSQYDIDLPITV